MKFEQIAECSLRHLGQKNYAKDICVIYIVIPSAHTEGVCSIDRHRSSNLFTREQGRIGFTRVASISALCLCSP